MIEFPPVAELLTTVGIFYFYSEVTPCDLPIYQFIQIQNFIHKDYSIKCNKYTPFVTHLQYKS